MDERPVEALEIFLGMAEFVKKTRIHRSADEVFAWHERPGAFLRLSPPWSKVSHESQEGGVKDGVEVRVKQTFGPFTTNWVVRHEGYVKGRAFSDRQVSGPFMKWLHHHRFEPAGENACDLVDHIVYELPMQTLTEKTVGKRVRGELERVFRYRHEVTRMDLETHRLPEAERPLSIAVTGATGLVGAVLSSLLRTSGHNVLAVSRGKSGDIQWNPEEEKIDPAAFEGLDAVVHLAGEPIAQRWSDAARKRIMKSRREGTRLLAETVAGLKRPPRVFVSVSGINAYGVAHSEPLNEEADFGEGFLADVCREWERSTEPVDAAGIRKVIVRSGMVLSPSGGALRSLLPIFRAGLGGPVGSGARWMSWISVDDAAAILAHAVLDDRYRGVINGVAPQAVRNKEFSKTLGRSLRRPAFAPVPPPVLKLAFGQMADETILSDLHVVPRRLGELDYRFRFPKLREALSHVLGGRS